jgi:collagen type VII alpha
MKNLLFTLILLFSLAATAQSVGINSDGSTPNLSAILDLKSTTKGFLPPRMNQAERLGIAAVEGLMVFQTDGVIGLYIFKNGDWTEGSGGVKGDTGATGAQGTIGLTGITGDQGIQGLTGAKGDTGFASTEAGPQGLTGAKGDAGAQGTIGLTGITGDQGIQGLTGAKGDTGIQGAKGDTGAASTEAGPQGLTGEKGDAGATGVVGAKGDQGDTGALGDTGAQGIQGEKGDAGATGAQGAIGSPGITSQQATDITTNNAKVGITTSQVNEIAANTAKVSYPGDQDISGIATNTTNITIERNRAIAAESLNATALKSKADVTAISDEVTRAQAAELALTNNLSLTDGNISSLFLKFDTFTTDVTAFGTTLTTAISDEVTRAQAAEAMSTLLISAESSARINADALQNTAIAANTAKVSYPGDQDISGIATNTTNITIEINRAIAAESLNATAISAETARAQAAELALTNKLSLTDGNISSLFSKLDTFTTDVTTFGTTLTTAISDEVTRAQAAEVLNAGTISAESSARTNADALQNAAIALNTAKVGYQGEQGLQGLQGDKGAQGDAGATGAQGAIGSPGITSQQATDITTNNAKVGITTSQVNEIEANTAKVSYPGDQDISGIATNTNNITIESIRAQAAELALTNNLSLTDGNISSLFSKFDTFTTDVNAFGTTLTTAIVAEATLARAAEGTLTTNLAFKAQIASPTFTGTVTIPVLVAGGSTYPVSLGNKNDVLTTDGSGVLSWSVPASGSAGGLVSVTEGSNTGYRRVDALAGNYGYIGVKAVDLSYSEQSSVNGSFGATGQYALATGTNTNASGGSSTAMGGSTVAIGDYSIALGYNTKASDYGSVVIGQYNSAGATVTNSNTNYSAENTAFVIGNGTSDDSKGRSDAFKVLFNGNTTITGNLTTAEGTITAAAFVGNGSGLYNLPSVSLANESVTTNMIANGTIVNLDIATNAGIDQSKISGLTAALGGKAPSNNPTFTGDIAAKRYVLTAPTAIGSTTTTTTIDLSIGNLITITLGTETTLTTSNAAVGTYLIKLVQNSSGNNTVTFPAAWKWSGSSAPNVTQTPLKTDIVTLIYDGSTFYAAISQNF